MANGHKSAVSVAPAKQAKAAPLRGAAKLARQRAAAENAHDLAIGLRALEELRTGEDDLVEGEELEVRLAAIRKG